MRRQTVFALVVVALAVAATLAWRYLSPIAMQRIDARRVAKFAAGGYDAIVLPINSYLLHGEPHHFPGAIVLAIAESRGADGIVAFADKVPGGKVTELDDAGVKIVYTRESPSSFLLDLTIADFELTNLAGSRAWRNEVGGV